MKKLIVLLVVVSVGWTLGCGGGADPEVPAEPTGIATLDAGWHEIFPGGDTKCSDGSEYKFVVRGGADPSKVVFYLQGGGGCWTGATCDPHVSPSYTQTVDRVDLSQGNGIFSLDNSDNPFADWSMVFVPYCTGDVHIGAKDETYSGPATAEHEAHEFTIHHQGTTNVAAALDWTYENVAAPEQIFVTGSSAGSIPSPYYASVLASHYPDAAVRQLGDGSGGYRGISQTGGSERWGVNAALSHWPEVADLAAEEFTFEVIYTLAAKNSPGVALAAYDTAEDDVQHQFLGLSGIQPEKLVELIDANQADIRAEAPGFRSFVAGGELHTILGRPEFYTYRVGETTVRDWVADLAHGEGVEDVHCDDCSVAEVVESAVSEAPVESGG